MFCKEDVIILPGIGGCGGEETEVNVKNCVELTFCSRLHDDKTLLSGILIKFDKYSYKEFGNCESSKFKNDYYSSNFTLNKELMSEMRAIETASDKKSGLMSGIGIWFYSGSQRRFGEISDQDSTNQIYQKFFQPEGYYLKSLLVRSGDYIDSLGFVFDVRMKR